MDYLTFVDRLISAAAALVASDYTARSLGVDVQSVAQRLELSVEGDFCRDPTLVPYRGAQSIRHRFGTEVFIRRLSHVAVATPEDISALETEASAARARS
jgi:predicted small secreted protein